MEAAASSLVRSIARRWAQARGRLRCHKDWPAANLLTPAEVVDTYQTIAEAEADLAAFNVDTDQAADIADQTPPEEQP